MTKICTFRLPSPTPGPQDVPPPTPLYDSLTTNLPHPSMAFSSFPFPSSTPLFPPAKTVEEYLQAYTDHFNLRPHIRLRTRVTNATYNHSSAKWLVRTSDLSQASENASKEHEFDLLLVCNGHHNVARYPRVKGLSDWLTSRRASHSVYYRNPSLAPFALDKEHTVLVVGGGPSGQDIVFDISPVVKTVIHSASEYSPSNPEKPLDQGNVQHRGRLVSFSENGTVEFQGGVIEHGIDYCILATGYEVSFPFIPPIFIKEGLPEAVPPLPRGTWNTSHGVFPLVRYLFPFSLSQEPSPSSSSVSPLPAGPPPTSIAFLGLLVRVIPMPLVEVQARAALAAFSNPSKVDWTREAVDVVQRYEELKTRLRNESGRSDDVTSEEKIQRALFRFEPMEQFDYRDSLVDMIAELEGRTSDDTLGVSRVKQWERDIYARKNILRQTWRALEASGESDTWISGVGEGRHGRSGEEEWVELMWKVVRRGEETGTTYCAEAKANL